MWDIWLFKWRWVILSVVFILLVGIVSWAMWPDSLQKTEEALTPRPIQKEKPYFYFED